MKTKIESQDKNNNHMRGSQSNLSRVLAYSYRPYRLLDNDFLEERKKYQLSKLIIYRPYWIHVHKRLPHHHHRRRIFALFWLILIYSNIIYVYIHIWVYSMSVWITITTHTHTITIITAETQSKKILCQPETQYIAVPFLFWE